jgi:membrane protease YdiL (CAAX protease family)
MTDTEPQEHADRRGGRVILFLILTFSVSAVIWTLMAFSEIVRSLSFLLLMWAPGVAAFVTCWVRRESVRNLGWKWRPWRYQAVSFLLPAGLSVMVYALIWESGLGRFNAAAYSEKGSTYILMATVGLVASIVLALGEEIGWRGLLVPALATRFGFTRTAFLSGVVWSAWHLPLILFYGYRSDAPLGYALLWGIVGMVAVSFPLAWLRLRSGSSWTAAILHGTHNILVQEILDPLTADTGPTQWLIGEFGCAIPLAWVGVAIVVWSRNR